MSEAATISAARWRDNWRAIAAQNAVRVEVPRGGASAGCVDRLPPGTPVVLVASAPGARRRCRSFAAAAGVQIEREYLAFPRASAPAYLVEDAPGPIRLFSANMLMAPPRGRWSLAIGAAVAIVRALRYPTLVRLLAPGRVHVGRVA